MPVRTHRSKNHLYILVVLAVLIVTVSAAGAQQETAEANKKEHQIYLPLLFRSPTSAQISGRDLINQMRANAGVPPVRYSPVLERNCFEHSRYMAENGILSHTQNPNYPYATSGGQNCAQQGNVWLGYTPPTKLWNSADPVRDWMGSVSHRIWLLYPTSTKFGYSFYTSQAAKNNGAAVDVLSGANFSADEAYDGWPVRYPGSGEKGIPAAQYPISLNWRYFGPEPEIGSVRLTTGSGDKIAHEATTQMSIGHKGIQIIPKTALPEESKIVVTVSGKYDDASFTKTWHFFTGRRPNSVFIQETPIEMQPVQTAR
jgi:uncharacterized protein YkwD